MAELPQMWGGWVGRGWGTAGLTDNLVVSFLALSVSCIAVNSYTKKNRWVDGWLVLSGVWIGVGSRFPLIWV